MRLVLPVRSDVNVFGTNVIHQVNSGAPLSVVAALAVQQHANTQTGGGGAHRHGILGGLLSSRKRVVQCTGHSATDVCCVVYRQKRHANCGRSHSRPMTMAWTTILLHRVGVKSVPGIFQDTDAQPATHCVAMETEASMAGQGAATLPNTVHQLTARRTMA